MEIPQQKLPMAEPGHMAPDIKMPRVEGATDDQSARIATETAAGTNQYPKHIEHPYGGTVVANDAEHEATLQASMAALPPAPEEPTFKFAEECLMLLKRDLTAVERAFCEEIETAAGKAHEDFMTADAGVNVPPGDDANLVGALQADQPPALPAATE